MTRPHLLDALRDRVLLCDGGMGSRVQAMDLDVERDFWGKENCTDVLVLSRPDIVREIHRGYFEAGADMVETNTFGGSPVTLASSTWRTAPSRSTSSAGELAREAAESFADGRHRWVIGGIGPGTKLPSLGNIAYDALEAALAGAVPRPDRRRRRRDADRDLPGHAADQGRGERRQDRPRRGEVRHADLRAGHGRDHRHAAGRPRYRRRGDGGACARRAADGAELRHRPAGDGRACRAGWRRTGPA